MSSSQRTQKKGVRRLWGKDIEIPFIQFSGPHGSGKTLALLGICPSESIYFGFEESAGTYNTFANLKTLIEAHTELEAKYGDTSYSPIDSFKWWLGRVAEIQKGEYRAILIDTNGDLEAGYGNYFATLHNQYRFSSPEKFKAMGGVFWKHGTTYFQNLLLKIRAKTGVETIAWASHLKPEWVGGKATSKKIAEGKQCWSKLSSFSVRLKRDSNEKGVIPDAPIGIVEKGRLAVPRKDKNGNTVLDEWGSPEWVAVNPPQIPNFSAKTLRYYIANPVGLRQLKKDEKVQVQQLSDDEKLEMQAGIAVDQRAIVEFQKAEKADRLALAKSAAAKPAPTGTPKPAAPTPVATITEDDKNKSLLINTIKHAFRDLLLTGDQAKAIINKRGVKKLNEMTYEQLSLLASNLDKKLVSQAVDGVPF